MLNPASVLQVFCSSWICSCISFTFWQLLHALNPVRLPRQFQCLGSSKTQSVFSCNLLFGWFDSFQTPLTWLPEASDQLWTGALWHIPWSVPGASLLLVPNQLQLCPPHLCPPGTFQTVEQPVLCRDVSWVWKKCFFVVLCWAGSTKCSFPISWRVWVSSPRMCFGRGWCSLTLADPVLSRGHLGIFGSCSLKSQRFLLEF